MSDLTAEKMDGLRREVERQTEIADTNYTKWQEQTTRIGELLKRIAQLEADNETLKAYNEEHQSVSVLKDMRIDKLEAEVDGYQQMQDEIIVALGSLGLLPSEIVPEIKRLTARCNQLHGYIYDRNARIADLEAALVNRVHS